VILKRIRLESFRCFARPLAIAFDERVTVVHGENGIGKSTLFEALARTLFDRPDSESAEIAALAPWGTEVAPRVELDVISEDVEFRVEKMFGARGSARVLRDGQPWKEGSASVEWLRTLLGATRAARGPSRPSERGLGQVLLVPQGEPDLPDQLGDGALERLHALVDAVLADPVSRAIESEIKRRAGELFTASGLAKKGAPAQTLRDERTRALERLEFARGERAKSEALRSELARASAEATAIAAQRRALSAERERITPQAREQRVLLERRDLARRALQAADNEFKRLAERIQRLADLRRDAVALDEKSAALAAAERDAGRAVDESLAAAQAAGEALRATETRRDQARALRKTAEAARALARTVEESAELEPRVAALAGAQAEARAIAEALTRAPGSFSGRRIEAFRIALKAEADAAAQVEALRLRVRIVASKAIELDGDKLRAGEERVLDGEGRLTLRLGGAELTISGPTVDHEAARAALERTRAAADAIAAELGSRDPSELEVWRANYKQLEADLRVAQTKGESALGKGESADGLHARLESARRAREAILDGRPAWRERAPEPGPLEAEARAAESAAEAALDEKRRDDEARRRAADHASITRDQVARERANAARQRKAIDEALAAASSDGLDDAAREAARRQRSGERQAAEDTVALAEDALAKIGENPAERLDRLAVDLDALYQAETRTQSAEVRAQQALDDALAGAPHAQLAAAEERLAVVEEELRRAEREADAVQLLSRLFAEEHAASSARLIEPVQKSVLPRLRKLAGNRPAIDELTLDEALRPAALGVRGLDAKISPSELSYGTRDQLALLVRLALGELAAGDERLPAVLDDPLVHADARRMKRFLSILDDSARRLQLVILTCRPDDYRALSGATFVDLGGSGDLFARSASLDG
jgi:energy-coupling factor transporter ATP-binding protein EcfA2